jgi:dsRNA-specific ribonuclease
MFLDFNKVSVYDEGGWFQNVFVTGPGFQMVQIFVENVFEQHVDWIQLIKNDDNYKNILQVKIQKEFKVTPHYMEVEEHHTEHGYHMGVYLCLGQPIHAVNPATAIPIAKFRSYDEIHQYMSQNGKILVYFGGAKHKIKKKAEQMACEHAIQVLDRFV